LCDNSEFRPGVVCQVPPPADGAGDGKADPQVEALVQALTDQIMKQLGAQ
jgi:L-fuculose-phosphate aldolase